MNRLAPFVVPLLALLLGGSLAQAQPSARTQPSGCAQLSFTVPLRFDLYQGRVDPSQSALLDQVAERLLRCPQTAVELAVHTDTVRMSSFNLRQSQAVADHVREQLTRRGVDASRIRACGYGEQLPVVQDPRWDGTSPNERLVVRRIEAPASAHRCRLEAPTQ